MNGVMLLQHAAGVIEHRERVYGPPRRASRRSPRGGRWCSASRSRRRRSRFVSSISSWRASPAIRRTWTRSSMSPATPRA